MIDEKQLQEWRKLADEATPGPWYDHNPDDKLCMNAYLVSTCEIEPSIIDLPNRDVIAFTLLQAPDAVSHAAWNWDSDAAFIAAARSAVPALLDEVARLNARVAELEARDDSGKTSVGEFIYHKGETGVWLLTDGCGNYWDKYCPNCGAPMRVIRPGDARCSAECYIKPEG